MDAVLEFENMANTLLGAQSRPTRTTSPQPSNPRANAAQALQAQAPQAQAGTPHASRAQNPSGAGGSGNGASAPPRRAPNHPGARNGTAQPLRSRPPQERADAAPGLQDQPNPVGLEEMEAQMQSALEAYNAAMGQLVRTRTEPANVGDIDAMGSRLEGVLNQLEDAVARSVAARQSPGRGSSVRDTRLPVLSGELNRPRLRGLRGGARAPSGDACADGCFAA